MLGVAVAVAVAAMVGSQSADARHDSRSRALIRNGNFEVSLDGWLGWRATFFVAGQAHSIVGGSAWETTPWRAAQRAAWQALATVSCVK